MASAQGSPPLDLLTSLLLDVPELRALSDPVAWALIKKYAARQGVAQLIAAAVRPHVHLLEDPAGERQWCDRILTASWTRHNRALGELDSVLGILGEAGIRTLVLKGPLLALRHYQPPLLRKPAGDVDLAIAGAELERAAEALRAAGYSARLPVREAEARSHHLEMTHASRPPVELHFRLSHGAYGVPVDSFFSRAVTCELPGGRPALALHPADEIFHLVLHRAYGRFATLFHLCEIRRLWRAATAEMRAETLDRAAEFHFAGAVAITDIAFRVRFGEAFLGPETAAPRTWLQRRINEKLYGAFERLSEPGRELPLGARLGRRWVDFQLTDRPADAARFAAVMLRVAWYQLRRKGWRTVRSGEGKVRTGWVQAQQVRFRFKSGSDRFVLGSF